MLATGHYRNGVLLTPITADVVAELVVHDRMLDVAAPFGPGAFRDARRVGPDGIPLMLIYVNGEQREVAPGTVVSEVVGNGDATPRRGIAVAVDGSVVPRARLAETTLPRVPRWRS